MNEKDKKIYCFFLLFSCFSESNGQSIKEPEAQFFRVDQTDNEFSDIEHVALSLSLHHIKYLDRFKQSSALSPFRRQQNSIIS